ncbi:hypothetical protein BGZ98_004535 [Dissophora globulifera]|nr:hypothetical protein BGZ98_004535 [Dissophora globulifera]
MQLRDPVLEPHSNATDIARVSKMREVIENARIQCGIPGMSIAVLHKGELVMSEGFGKRNDKDPFTPETVMSIASLTKAFTAAAIGELVAEGKMDWDKTPISKYLPDFELKDPLLTSQLTLVDLLSHRTPLPNIDLAAFRSTEPRRDFIKRLRHIDLDTKLSSTCNYNNIMYAVAGEAAASVAGVSYEAVVETRILEPLGLSNTGLSPLQMKQRHPDNYAMPYDATSFENAQKGVFVKGYVDPIYMLDAPAGDIYSNVLDLAKWGRVVMKLGELDGKQVLNKESTEEILSAQTIMKRPRRSAEYAPAITYALGWILDTYKGQVVYKHNGSNPGYRSELIMFPDADLVIAQLANVNIAQLLTIGQYYIADEFPDLPRTQEWVPKLAVESTRTMYDFYTKENSGDYPERIKHRASSHELESFVGTYSNPVYGEVSVSLGEKEAVEGVKRKELHIQMRTLVGKLEHYHYDSFTTSMVDFVVRFESMVSFVTGEDGKISGFKMKIIETIETFEKKVTAKEEDITKGQTREE